MTYSNLKNYLVLILDPLMMSLYLLQSRHSNFLPYSRVSLRFVIILPLSPYTVCIHTGSTGILAVEEVIRIWNIDTATIMVQRSSGS